MTHVTPETASRLKDAGFQQPEKPGIGQAWIFSFLPDTVLVIGSQVEGPIPWGGLFHAAETFLPTATDIMQHLPGWDLSFENGIWICSLQEDEFILAEYRNSNPAEAAADAFFFEQSHAKKPTCRKCGGEMSAGIALENLVAGSSEWPDGDMSGATFGMSTDTKAVRVMKCEKCGHSFKA